MKASSCQFQVPRLIAAAHNLLTMADFKLETLQEQKFVHGQPFPLLVLPADVSKKSHYKSLAETIERHRHWINKRLHQCRALLFRGFELHDASDFDLVVKSLGYAKHDYVDGEDDSRKNVTERVLSLDFAFSPEIPFHNEMAYLESYPDTILFFCEVEPAFKGSTFIVSGLRVLEIMTKERPEFVAKLREKGVLYVTYYENKDKDKAIERLQRGQRAKNMKLEFLPDGRVKQISIRPFSVFNKEPGSGMDVFFNSMATRYHWKETNVYNLYFGDGSEIAADDLDAYMRILQEERVSIKWKKGDVLVLDNIAAMHSREDFKPPRRILASLCKRLNDVQHES